jgi:ketosteroid isomerase-like protein
MVAAALVVLCLLCGSITAYNDSDKEVEQAFNHFIAAFNNLDWDLFRKTLADDVSVFNPDIAETSSVNRLDGRDLVEAGFKSVFAATREKNSGPPYLHIVPKNVRIQRYNDSAIVTFEFEREGNSFGRRTIVFHRESAGWKIVHIHASNVTQRN